MDSMTWKTELGNLNVTAATIKKLAESIQKAAKYLVKHAGKKSHLCTGKCTAQCANLCLIRMPKLCLQQHTPAYSM